MKTYNNLWNDLISFENIYCAAQNAQKSKRYKSQALLFNYNLESNILRLRDELLSGEYRPGQYHQFEIYEPKQRFISAAPYRDRVVHHALINIIEPIWESRFYYHSYACRKEKGTHKAVDICQQYLRKNQYLLKCDIEKYFPSIDHQILKQIVRGKIADKKVLALTDLIIDSSPINEVRIKYFPGDTLFSPIELRQGIPIGNLTSQFFANLYLNELDQWLKNTCKVHYYLRYMDDFIVFHNSKEYLKILRSEIRDYLAKLRLSLHQTKQQIYPAKNGIPFLGFQIYRDNRRLRKENIRRFMTRMKRKQKLFYDTKIQLSDIRQSLMAWIGHAGHGNTYHLRKDLFEQFVF